MSQHSSSLVDPSQSQSHMSSLHYHRCWWAWCRHSFYTKKELLNHVILEHAQKAQPVRLADIHTLQAAENSYWDFGSSPSIPSSLSIQKKSLSQASQASPIDIPSSLPSPPASSPPDPGTPVHKQPPTDLFAEDVPLQVPCALVQPQLSSVLLTPSSKPSILDVHLFAPSFASLSSINSPDEMSYDVPDSPCFDLLVTEATSRPIQSMPAMPESQDSNDVASEKLSQESVFNQLTQGIDDTERSQEPEPHSSNRNSMMDVDSDDVPGAPQATLQPQSSQPDAQEPSPPPPAPLQIQTRLLPTTLPSSPSYFHSPVCPSATIVTRQSWYQPQRRRPSKKKSASEASVGHSSPTSSPFAKTTPSPIPAHFLPVTMQAVQPPTSVTSQVFYSAPQSQTQSQEESWTQTDSIQLSSYHLLTQAPLRSQSSSQD